MIETVFYLQVFVLFILLVLGIVFRSWPFFLLAAVISISLGAQLAALEPVEFFTGGFVTNRSGDVFTAVPDLNRLTIANSPSVNSWHYMLLYGGFVWLIVAALMIFRTPSFRSLFGGGGRSED